MIVYLSTTAYLRASAMVHNAMAGAAAVWLWSVTTHLNDPTCVWTSEVNKVWTCKDKDKDKDFTYSYLLQVAAKPIIAIKQQQWTQWKFTTYDCKTHYTK